MLQNQTIGWKMKCTVFWIEWNVFFLYKFVIKTNFILLVMCKSFKNSHMCALIHTHVTLLLSVRIQALFRENTMCRLWVNNVNLCYVAFTLSIRTSKKGKCYRSSSENQNRCVKQREIYCNFFQYLRWICYNYFVFSSNN